MIEVHHVPQADAVARLSPRSTSGPAPAYDALASRDGSRGGRRYARCRRVDDRRDCAERTAQDGLTARTGIAAVTSSGASRPLTILLDRDPDVVAARDRPTRQAAPYAGRGGRTARGQAKLLYEAVRAGTPPCLRIGRHIRSTRPMLEDCYAAAWRRCRTLHAAITSKRDASAPLEAQR